MQTRALDSGLVHAFVEQILPRVSVRAWSEGLVLLAYFHRLNGMFQLGKILDIARRHTFRFLIDNETSTHTDLANQPTKKDTSMQVPYLKYSFVASKSPSSPKTEKRIPLGCVFKT
jgi:hypothetical protein